MVMHCDLLRVDEECHWLMRVGLGTADGVGAELRVGLHDDPFVGRQLAGLEQHVVWNADLADVVQRRRLGHQCNAALVQLVGEARVQAHALRQRTHVFLGAQDVVAGFVVAGFREPCEGADGDVLDHQVLAHALCHIGLEGGLVGAQQAARLREFQMGIHARQHDRRTQGFGDVVDRAQFEAALLVFGGAHCGGEDHRDVACGGIGAQPFQHFVAAHVGHHHIQQDEVRQRHLRGKLKRQRAGICRPHLVVPAQQLTEHGQVFGVVVDDQNGSMRHVPPTARHGGSAVLSAAAPEP